MFGYWRIENGELQRERERERERERKRERKPELTALVS